LKSKVRPSNGRKVLGILIAPPPLLRIAGR